MLSIITTKRNSTITAPTYTTTSVIARNSASSSSHSTALCRNANTRNSTECTGLRAVITPSAATSNIAANAENRTVVNKAPPSIDLSIRRVRRLVRGDHRFVLVADGEQLVLRHDVLAAPLHVKLVNPRLHDRIDRAGFLAEAAIDALEEIDVVAGRAARAVRSD